MTEILHPPTVTERSPEEKEADRRLTFIQSLRDLASFLEEQPTVTAPKYVVLNVFVQTREEMATHARVPGGWEKNYGDTWFYLTKHFGDDLRLDITTERETVCRKVVTGTRLVEATPAHEVEEFTWECDDASLLAGGAQ